MLGCPFSLIVPLDQSLGFPEEDLPVWLLESVVFPGVLGRVSHSVCTLVIRAWTML